MGIQRECRHVDYAFNPSCLGCVKWERDELRSRLETTKGMAAKLSADVLWQRERAERAELQVESLRKAAQEKLDHDQSPHYGGRCAKCFAVDRDMAEALKGVVEKRVEVCPWEALKGGEKCTFPKGHGGLHSFHGDPEKRNPEKNCGPTCTCDILMMSCPTHGMKES